MTSGKSGQTDNVLQFINKNFITLQDDDKKHYMPHYQKVLQEIVILMKKEDKLFEAIYQNLYWAGSYYDGLKVGKPEEYDVDVVMNLPIPYESVQISNKKVTPPFTKINMKEMDKLKQHPRWTEVYRHLDAWTDKDGFLLQAKFRTWMESAVNKALLTLTKSGAASQLTIENQQYLITLKKSGPAMTFNITIPGGRKLDVDFVPVIEFKKPQWPPHPVRKNPSSSRDSWFIVPKPNSKNAAEFQDTYWRLAFHDQEREMINGKEQLKPVCRLLKKFRDNIGLKCICSYYLKTMFLWEIIEQKDPAFWRSGLTNQFMTMLKKLHENVKNRKAGIKYFWDDRYDFLLGMPEAERCNIDNRLNNIIKDIEKRAPEDPTILAKYLLNKEEMAEFTAAHRKAEQQSQSPVPAVNGKKEVELSKDLPAANVPGEPANDISLATIVKLLNEQKKLTQTVLNKQIILQDYVERLVDENASLRDEFKMLKQPSRGSLLDTTTSKGNDLLTQTVLNKVNMLQDSVERLADENVILRDELKMLKQPSSGLLLDTTTTKGIDLLSNFDLLDAASGTEMACSERQENLLLGLSLSPSRSISQIETVTPKIEMSDLLVSFDDY